MPAAPLPAREAERLAALQALDILDTPGEAEYDDFTKLAVHLCGTPIALLSLVDEARQWFKSRIGLDTAETPRDAAFCAYAIHGRELLEVPDALTDDRFNDSPLVTGSPNIRFYAGAPLVMADGLAMGTLCVIDRVPRELTPEQRDALSMLGRLAVRSLEHRRAVAALRRSEALNRAVLESAVDGITVIDQFGTIQSFNPAAERIFGWSASEVIGRNVNMLMPEPYFSAHDGYLHNYMTTNRKRVIGIGRQVDGRRRDGSTFPLELGVSEVTAGSKRLFAGITRDISARVHHEQLLRDRAHLLSRTEALASIGSWEWHAPSGTVSWSDQMYRLLGHEPESVEPSLLTWSHLLHPEDRERAVAALKATIQRDVPYDEDFRVILATGEERYFRGRVEVQRSPDGRAERAIGMAMDITALKEAERTKNEFVSTVSHELRTPLTSIRGALGLALGGALGALPEKVQAMLEMANRNCERLSVLINDILDLEKIESGSLDFTFAAVDLVQVVRNALAEFKGYADRFEVALTFRSEPVTAVVSADAHRLLQVLVNLLSNAIKFSPIGGTVDVSLSQRDGDFLVQVRDNGRGIPDHFRDRIFGRFAQADSSDAREKGGTGLGLSIAKAIIERHQGTIGFHSIVGQGTTFHFTLAAAETAPSAPVDGAMQASVLICEDHSDTAAVLAALLAQEGLTCDTVATAGEAKTLLSQRSYRVLLLDLALPDQDGLAMLDEISVHSDMRELPVIVVSGTANQRRQSSPTDSAVSVMDWLQKPVEEGQLRKALQRAIHAGRHPRALHVEDNADVARVVEAVLKDIVEYRHTASLADARAALQRERFDLVILDLVLPDGSGLDLLGDLGDQCPVVVFSGRGADASVKGRVTETLLKSGTSNLQLLSAVRRALHARGHHAQRVGGRS